MNASRKRNEINQVLARGMTVARVIEALQDMPDDAVVVFGSDYGDICHTEQALVVRKVDELELDCERLTRSAYSLSGLAIESLDDEDESDDQERLDVPEPCLIAILRS